LNESNNTRSATLTVDPLPNSPDVVVEAIRWSEDDGQTWHQGPVTAGKNVLFAADIKNRGMGPTPDGVIIGVAFLVNHTYVAWSDTRTTALPAGQTISLRANGGPDGDKYWNNAQAGSYTIRAWVDDINRIPNELDETNNTLDVPMTVGTPTGIQARQADKLVDSIGVNTHFSQSDYQNNYTAGANLKQKLGNAGIRYIRDGCESNNSTYGTIIVDLYNTYGIKITFIVGAASQQLPTAAYNWINNTLGWEKIAAMEGLNEPAGSVAAVTHQTQVSLWNTFRVNGVAAAKALPIAACSPTSRADANAHRDYGISQGVPWPTICDRGNVHPYQNAHYPETTGWGAKDPEGDYYYGSLQFNTQIAEVLCGAGHPLLFGECGYRYALGASGQASVPDAVGGIYTVRQFLWAFKTSIPSGAYGFRTFNYQLLDDSDHFKLVNTDGTVTAAFTGVSNLIALLTDPGVSFSPGYLGFTMSGSTADVQTVLLQKRDGVFYLAIWLALSIWNPDTLQNITVNPQSVAVTFNNGVSSVERVFPNDGTTWSGLTVTNNQVALSIQPKVMILRIVPSSLSAVVAVPNG
jgi:hypothetical protein